MISRSVTPARSPQQQGLQGDPITDALAAIEPLSLPELINQAELQHRIDHKYILSEDQLVRWIGTLGPDLQVLEIDHRRSFGYESIYFDTPDLLTFRQHRQGRRRRFKIRSRTYTDSGDCTFEVKLEGRRGVTIKDRRPHPIDRRAELTAPAWEQLADVLGNEGLPVPPTLAPVQRLFYRRSTLLLPDVPARITIDTGLSYRGRGGRAKGPDDHVVVEVKSESDRNRAVRSLTAMGLRPVQISKYCVGTALLTGASANRWHPVIKRYFRRVSRARW